MGENWSGEGFKKSDGFAALLSVIGVAVAVALIAFEKLFHPTPEQWFWVLLTCIVIILLCAANAAILFLNERTRFGVFRVSGVLLVNLGIACLTFGLAIMLSGQPAHTLRDSGELSKRATAVIGATQDIRPIIDALVQSQAALRESKQTRGLLAQITDQFDQLNRGISAQENLSGRRVEDRLAAAEHIIKELRIVLGNVHQQDTPRGKILIIKTAANTFRVTFTTPMRVAPQLKFIGIPDGSTPQVTEHSALGFTVVFLPPTIGIDHFVFEANARL